MRSSGGSSRFRASGVALAAVAALAVVAGACSAHGDTHRRAPVVSQKLVGTTSTTLDGQDAAVIDAWTAAENTLYGYLQRPWQKDRAALTANEPISRIWPSLLRYFVGGALQSEENLLIKTTMAELAGPTEYNLGYPRLSSLAPRTAVVKSCLYDTGNRLGNGSPASVDLGGGAGYYKGSWTLSAVAGAWKISSFRTETVQKC